MFLNDNGGPGIQHIAFHTNNIVESASTLLDNDACLITPPPDYYSIVSLHNILYGHHESFLRKPIDKIIDNIKYVTIKLTYSDIQCTYSVHEPRYEIG